jgi:hypothetical protein
MSDNDGPNQPGDDTSVDDDYSSSANGGEGVGEFIDGEESEQTTDLQLAPLKLATVTCLHKYAIARMEGAENTSLPWPPLMLVVLDYLNKKYKRRELVTERNITMLELMLRVPIQLRIRRAGSGDTGIDLNDDASLDYTGMSFVESLEILRDLLEANVITRKHIRTSATQLLLQQ